MKKAIIKGTVIGAVFFIALFVISYFVNLRNNDLTVEMASASYPLVYMQKDGVKYNCLHGYCKVMDAGFERDTITVLDANRSTDIIVEPFGNDINDIGYEVRSVDGSRLIETGSVSEYSNADGNICFNIALKDLIEADEEYCLVILLTCDNKDVIRYYTRVVWAEEYSITQKLEFVDYFYNKTFQKEAAGELKKYLESNSRGDNSSFSRVDIHSSLSQVTWGDLKVTPVTKPVPDIMDITKQTASIEQTYYVTTGDDGNKIFYRVSEYYRIRYTKERTYLLDFERTMGQIFSENNALFANNKLNLGIVCADFDFLESEDGNIFVFENEGRLFSYNVTDNKLAVLFGFYDGENSDERTMNHKHGLQVLNVDEAGNIQFAAYGYMNRGRHEGDVGIQIYYYDSTLNTVEETVYIPFDKSAEVLLCEMQKLFYMNRDNILFFMLEGTVYALDLTEKTYDILAGDMNDESIRVSDNGKMIVWQNGQNVYNCQKLTVTDLSSIKQIEIQTENGECILPLGFMGEDLIYGLAKPEDITADNAGRVVFPMYVLYIQNIDGQILKEYRQDNIYITGCEISDNRISLSRLMRDEYGNYSNVNDDQIMSSETADTGKNQLETISTDIYEKQVQIVLKDNVDVKSLKVLTPKEVLFEGGREIQLRSTESNNERFYVYGPGGVEGIYMNPSYAVNLAYDRAGVVTDSFGRYIFRKGNRVTRNQIMAIEAESADEERNSVSVCLDTMLMLEGVVVNTQLQINNGKSPYEILKDSLNDYLVLDLSGCLLDAVLFYVNQDIPVMAMLQNGNAVLITGFNETQIVIMDPATGKLGKKSMKDAAEWFEENGNSFLTYVEAAGEQM